MSSWICKAEETSQWVRVGGACVFRTSPNVAETIWKQRGITGGRSIHIVYLKLFRFVNWWHFSALVCFVICGQKLSPTVNQVTLNQPFSSRLSFCFVLMCLFLFKLGADGRINPNISAGIGIWLTSPPSLDQFLQFLLHSRGIAHMEFHHITNWQEHTNSNTLNVHKLFVHCM